MGVSGGLLVTSWFVGSFDQQAFVEAGSGAAECDEVGCVDCSPSGLGGLDQFERHRHAGGPGSGAFGDSLPESDGGEGRLDRVAGAQVDPVLGGVVEELQQYVEVVGDLGGGFWPELVKISV